MQLTFEEFYSVYQPLLGEYVCTQSEPLWDRIISTLEGCGSPDPEWWADTAVGFYANAIAWKGELLTSSFWCFYRPYVDHVTSPNPYKPASDKWNAAADDLIDRWLKV